MGKSVTSPPQSARFYLCHRRQVDIRFEVQVITVVLFPDGIQRTNAEAGGLAEIKNLLSWSLYNSVIYRLVYQPFQSPLNAKEGTALIPRNGWENSWGNSAMPGEISVRTV